MAIYLDETKLLRMYKGQFRYPINTKDRLKGSLVYLMTPSLESSINTLNMKPAHMNGLNFQAYFLEKNVQFYIDNALNEHGMLTINDSPVPFDHSLNESFDLSDESEISINEDALFSVNDDYRYRLYFPDFVDALIEAEVLDEETLTTKYGKYNLTSIFRSLLYHGRMKNQAEVLKLYEEVKRKCDDIKMTFVTPSLYKGRNLYYDWSFYTELYFKNKHTPGDKALDVFGAFIDRFLADKRFTEYSRRTIVIPFQDWVKEGDNPLDHTKTITPINLLYRSLKLSLDRFRNWKDSLIVFITNQGFFTMKLGYFNATADLPKFINLIQRMKAQDYTGCEEITQDSKLVIMNHLANTISKSGIKINNLTAETGDMSKEDLDDKGYLEDPTVSDDPEVKKAALINKLEKVAEKNTTVDSAIKDLDTESDQAESDWMKNVLMDLQSNEGIRMNKARAERHDKMQEELLKKEVRGKTVMQLLDQFATNDDIEETSIPVDSIDDHWKHVKFPNFNAVYTKEDMQADIMAMFYHFTQTSHPMNLLDIEVENTSTSEDFVDTWTVHYEDAESGKRSTVKVDIPRMVGDRFMKLRGNEKVLIGQLMLLPIIKTDEDTVQIVSNYNKIFVRRKSPSGFGKSTPIVNKMIKVFNKYDGKDFEVIPGDNRKVCSRYALPVSFIDIASLYSKIKFKDGSYVSFNMDNLKKIPFNRDSLSGNDAKLSDDELAKKYMAIYVKGGKKEPIIGQTVDEYLLELLTTKSERFVDLYNVAAVSKRLMFSEASILSIKIPVAVVVSYTIGLTKMLNKIGIKWTFQEQRPKKGESYLKFSDGYLVYYPRSDADNMLLNGLMQIETEEFSVKEVDSKEMWLAVLDDYGGRIKADGLDNFADLMMDPITVEICKIMHIPYEYIEALLYASGLLTDSKYNRHSDITGNRLRVNEVIVAHLYSVLAKEYGAYRNMVKRNKGQAAFTCKRSAVIDSILTHDQTSSDLSTLTPLLEAEAASKVTFKGLSGMNSERAFSMEKRTYDESMLGVLGLSTGFANTVGINRQTTIDSGIRNKRGFVIPADPKKLDNLSTFSIMEALSPLAINRDDPMRTAMAFTQTVQHQMTVKKSMPNLVSTGADEALPYLTSQKFSYKFKGKRGTIKEITDTYIVVEDDDTKECDFIDLREKIQKNSDGGFYITTKLDANINIHRGSKVKFNDIIAYNRGAYSPSVGNGAQKDPNAISYNIGTLSKIAILNTAMGFEDSCVVDHTMSRALSFELVVQKEVNLAPSSNIFSVVKVGDKIEEGEPLIIFSDAFEDEDAAAIMRSLAIDNPVISDIGRKKVHAKVSGVIQDIKVYRTCELDKLSPPLRKFVDQYEANVAKVKAVMKKYKIDKEYELEPNSRLPMEGKLKATDGIKIEFYIKTIDHYAAGDKLTFYQGLKGVCSALIPKGQEAATDFRPEEHVNGFLTSTGVAKRMVSSCISLGLLNKALIELTRQCQEDLGIKWRPFQEILMDGIED